jgi:hypothetical protein
MRNKTALWEVRQENKRIVGSSRKAVPNRFHQLKVGNDGGIAGNHTVEAMIRRSSRRSL